MINNLVRRACRHRRGMSALFIGLTLPVIFGIVALSVDLSVVAVARSQLSTGADAAALAGAQQLAADLRVTGTSSLDSVITAANTAATTFAQDNNVLGQAPVITANSSNSSSGQIVVGYLDPTSTSATFSNSGSTSSFNAVQVTLARDSSHGGLIPRYFSNLMGFPGASQTVTSTAVAQNYSISGFKAVGSNYANLLPIVLNQSNYDSMMAGTSGDQYTWNSSTQTVTSGPDGIAESTTYPVSGGLAGNWGTIKVGVSNNSTSTLGAQIQYGITPAQLATFPNSTITAGVFSANPGISAGLKSSLEAIIGQPRALPIYNTSGGNGNNAWYNVYTFQAVRIMAVNFQGGNKYVIVQPALLQDPTAIASTPQSWTSGGVVKLFLAR